MLYSNFCIFFISTSIVGVVFTPIRDDLGSRIFKCFFVPQAFRQWVLVRLCPILPIWPHLPAFAHLHISGWNSGVSTPMNRPQLRFLENRFFCCGSLFVYPYDSNWKCFKTLLWSSFWSSCKDQGLWQNSWSRTKIESFWVEMQFSLF